MNQTPTAPETPPAKEGPSDATLGPLSDEEAHRLDVKTERDARRQVRDAIEGILAEGDEILEEDVGTEAPDAGLTAAAQAVEHDEITRHGTLKHWATLLGFDDTAAPLDETLPQEPATDESLTALADVAANVRVQGAAAA